MAAEMERGSVSLPTSGAVPKYKAALHLTLDALPRCVGGWADLVDSEHSTQKDCSHSVTETIVAILST